MTNQEFILSHRQDKVEELALRKVPEEVDLRFCLQQIQGWQLARHKLPSWSHGEGILYPPKLSMEQCSSEQTGLYKKDLVSRKIHAEARQSMADLTGGFGVDFSFLASLFQEATYVECQEQLCRVASHNLPLLGLPEAHVVQADSKDYLSSMNEVDFLFLDPARRDESGRKTVALSDCTPCVPDLLPLLLKKAKMVMLKLSPMLDISQALRELGGVEEVHVLSVDGECKELLLCVNGSFMGTPLMVASGLSTKGGKTFRIKAKTLLPTSSQGDVREEDLQQGLYLYEPDAAVLKAGLQDVLPDRYGVRKLHPFSNLYISSSLVDDFPGRCFVLQNWSRFGKKELKAFLREIPQANLAVRNFPKTVAELRREWKLREGGSKYLFATTLSDGSHILLCNTKV